MPIRQTVNHYRHMDDIHVSKSRILRMQFNSLQKEHKFIKHQSWHRNCQTHQLKEKCKARRFLTDENNYLDILKLFASAPENTRKVMTSHLQFFFPTGALLARSGYILERVCVHFSLFNFIINRNGLRIFKQSRLSWHGTKSFYRTMFEYVPTCPYFC